MPFTALCLLKPALDIKADLLAVGLKVTTFSDVNDLLDSFLVPLFSSP